MAVAAAAATMVGGELGILCFFESLLQEQCRFLWVSPPPALHQPCCPVLPPSDPLLEKWGGDLGGSWPLECMALLDQHHLCPRARPQAGGCPSVASVPPLVHSGSNGAHL